MSNEMPHLIDTKVPSQCRESNRTIIINDDTEWDIDPIVCGDGSLELIDEQFYRYLFPDCALPEFWQLVRATLQLSRKDLDNMGIMFWNYESVKDLAA